MRHLILHRQRALACFAIKYHCILNQDREAFLCRLQRQDPLALLEEASEYMLRNGETISIDISCEERSAFFVAVYLEKRNIVTQEIIIEPGGRDVSYEIRTDYDGNRRLDIGIVPQA